MILGKRPSQKAMEETLRTYGYIRETGSAVRLDAPRAGHEEAPSRPAVHSWFNPKTGDRVLLVTTGGGLYYDWQLFLAANVPNDLEGALGSLEETYSMAAVQELDDDFGPDDVTHELAPHEREIPPFNPDY